MPSKKSSAPTIEAKEELKAILLADSFTEVRQGGWDGDLGRFSVAARKQSAF